MTYRFDMFSGVLGAVLMLFLSACDRSTDVAAPVLGGDGELKAEAFCDVQGLKPSLRHTYLLIDESIITKTETPADFVIHNVAIRDAVLALADPVRAISSGAADFRERVSIIVMRKDGSGGGRVFTGCVPALSPEEQQQIRSESSAVSDFFSGGVAQKLQNEVADFQGRLVGSLQLAARQAPGPASPQTGEFADTALIKSLRASGRLINSDAGVPRLVLITNLGGVHFPPMMKREEARKAGFELGKTIGLDFGRADVLVIQPSGGEDLHREFMDAFLLAQHGGLAYWGDYRVGALAAAPVSVSRYAGDAAYPKGPETLQIRIGIDRNGKLVNSWVLLKGRPDRSTPMTGNAVCGQDGRCEIRSDQGGFAQAWSLAPGGEPEFDPEAPFGGMRDFQLISDRERVTGRVFDAAISQIGDAGDSIAIKAAAQPDARF